MLDAMMNGDADAQLPLTALNEAARHVATISKKKAPRLALFLMEKLWVF